MSTALLYGLSGGSSHIRSETKMAGTCFSITQTFDSTSSLLTVLLRLLRFSLELSLSDIFDTAAVLPSAHELRDLVRKASSKNSSAKSSQKSVVSNTSQRAKTARPTLKQAQQVKSNLKSSDAPTLRVQLSTEEDSPASVALCRFPEAAGHSSTLTKDDHTASGTSLGPESKLQHQYSASFLQRDPDQTYVRVCCRGYCFASCSNL